MSAAQDDSRLLPELMLSQLAVNAAMAGQRMATPLQALRAGHAPWSVGLLLALFTLLPIVTGMAAGRMADRLGYQVPLRFAVGLTFGGAALSLLACWLPADAQFVLLCLAAIVSGAGVNICGIATQRTGGLITTDATARLRIFSWLAMAPALASAVGPVLAGVLIDLGGFAWAYAALMILPLVALLSARRVPGQTPQNPSSDGKSLGSLSDLLAVPGLRRLLIINWLLSASWDVHSFAVPVLGLARGYGASTIGLVLGSFTLAVAAVRFVVPLLAHRVNAVTLLVGAMLATGAIFIAYPFASTPWSMALCAALLGLTLGAVQPTVVWMLYQLAPTGRHGEAIALRSMAISASNTAMPLAFGVAGTVLGPGVMFWVMGAAVGAGSWAAHGLRRTLDPKSP